MTWRSFTPLIIGSFLLADCGGGSGGGAAPATVAVADLASSKLQFAVGTVNAASTSDQTTISGPILNLVETFRQPNGLSALLSDRVSLTGPASFVVTSLNSPAVTNDGGAPNQIIDTLVDVSAFGQSFGSNANVGSGAAQPASFTGSFPYEAGGPPAFPRTTDGNYPPGFSYGSSVIGIGGSSQIFPHGFPLGTYTLTVTTPPGSSASHTWTASAKLSKMTMLPTIPAPQLAFDGLGGGAVSFVVPAGLSELFVAISSAADFCWPFATNTSDQTGTQTSSGIFTLFVKAPKAGPLTLAIPDNLGPPSANANAPTFCSVAQNLKAAPTGPFGGAQASVEIIGTDYPLYEMSYPQSIVQLPTIVGSTGQSDATISLPTSGTAP